MAAEEFAHLWPPGWIVSSLGGGCILYCVSGQVTRQGGRVCVSGGGGSSTRYIQSTSCSKEECCGTPDYTYTLRDRSMKEKDGSQQARIQGGGAKGALPPPPSPHKIAPPNSQARIQGGGQEGLAPPPPPGGPRGPCPPPYKILDPPMVSPGSVSCQPRFFLITNWLQDPSGQGGGGNVLYYVWLLFGYIARNLKKMSKVSKSRLNFL